ncbi:MAG: malonyl-CoA decarboxylase [Verrucomicrobia bacterium]|nr:malonyl-CoA decarboxylase [Verrucomicrobiota bacterium]
MNKASVKRLDALVDLFEEIRSRDDHSAGLLQRFQDGYRAVPREERPRFFETLIRRFRTPKKAIEEDLRLLLAASEADAVQWARSMTDLRRKIESPRLKAFRSFMNLSGGLKFLLDFRADILAAQRQADVNLGPLDEDIAHLFDSWFQQGFLFLQEITLDSPYRQIRFLKDHDLVHPMTSLDEMATRLGEDRRCFSLYHRAMPEEPVVFIEVALTKGIARSIHDVIGESQERGTRKGTPDTAVFYSINNTQNGLAGLGLGKVLIFQVVDALKKGNPDIKTFSTLSPIPGFWERYLKRVLQGGDNHFSMKMEKLEEFFPAKVRQRIMDKFAEVAGGEAKGFGQALAGVLSQPGWLEDPEYFQLLKKPLTEITYFYITQEKGAQGKPLNPVTNFHMGNGAKVSLRNVNFAANRLPRGLEESCGMMVNYVYSMPWLHQIGRSMQSLLPRKA